MEPGTRRHFLWVSAAVLATAFIPGCGNSAPPFSGSPTGPQPGPSSPNRLTARPGAPTVAPTFGLTALGLETGRDGLLYVPQSYSPDAPAPLLVALHGAGGSSDAWATYYPFMESRGMVLLAIESRSTTWDLLRGVVGPDVEFLDLALLHAFDRLRIDPMRLALMGFSDGASYALSLGPANGDLFSHLIAHSPGLRTGLGPLTGRPRIYVSHGTADNVLPVGTTRNTIVPALREAGYSVTYEEFDGGHAIPRAITDSALDWFVSARASPGS